MKEKFPILLLLLLTLLTLWSASNPHEWQVWWTEMASVLILVGLLVVTYRQFRFSNTSYLLMFVWSAMQVIGAHYTFELVPFDTISRIFSFERNHYDRVAHFAVGMGGMAAAELFISHPFSALSLSVPWPVSGNWQSGFMPKSMEEMQVRHFWERRATCGTPIRTCSWIP